MSHHNQTGHADELLRLDLDMFDNQTDGDTSQYSPHDFNQHTTATTEPSGQRVIKVKKRSDDLSSSRLHNGGNSMGIINPNGKKGFTENQILAGVVIAIIFAISALALTIYTINVYKQPDIPPLYRHVSPFGPKYKIDEHSVDDQTAAAQFFPAVWLPTVDRDTILETMLSQSNSELYVDLDFLAKRRTAMYGAEDTNFAEHVPVLTQDELDTHVLREYPMEQPEAGRKKDYAFHNLFISKKSEANTFPITLPATRNPVTVHINKQYVPVNTVYVIQFYASWCGHCRRYSAHAEALAQAFNAQQNSPVRMLRVHCAGSGKTLCEAFNIQGYPTVLVASTRTWLWALQQIMPEFYERLGLWYVRSRGSAPPPGQQGLLNNQLTNLKQLDPAIFKENIIAKIPPKDLADGQTTMTWINTWLKYQYGLRHDHFVSLYRGISPNNGDGNNNNNININIGRPLSDFNWIQETTKATNLFLEDNYFSLQNAAAKYYEANPIENPKNDPTLIPNIENVDINPLKFELYGMPLPDMTSYTIMPNSIKLYSQLYDTYKPTRYFDKRINQGIRPSLIMGLYSGMSVYLPVDYKVLSEEELRALIIGDFSSSKTKKQPEDDKSQIIITPPGGETKQPEKPIVQPIQPKAPEPAPQPPTTTTPPPNNSGNNNNNNNDNKISPDFSQGYPTHANLHDKMLYWSMSLREAIPQCHRSMVSAAQRREMLSAPTRAIADSSLNQKILNLTQSLYSTFSTYAAGSGDIYKIDKGLLFKSTGGNQPGDEVYNHYLDSETCYEALYDMLDILCTFTSRQPPTPAMLKKDSQQFTFYENTEQQCQHSFCILKNNLHRYIYSPWSDGQLYGINNIHRSTRGPYGGVVKPTIPPSVSTAIAEGRATGLQDGNARANGGTGKIIDITDDISSGGWNLCFKPWSYWDVQDWQQCKGSVTYSRGYTCGLWLNLHSLTSTMHKQQKDTVTNITPSTDRQAIVSTFGGIIPQSSRFMLSLRGYLKHYFMCDECQTHFLNYSNDLPYRLAAIATRFKQDYQADANNNNDMLFYPLPKYDETTNLPILNKKKPQNNNDGNTQGNKNVVATAIEQYNINDTQYLMLWLWHIHNTVNQRLSTVEKIHKVEDPVFPKVYYPLHHMCPNCRIPNLTTCSATKGGDSTKITDLSESCLWDEHWDYANVLRYIEDAYSALH